MNLGIVSASVLLLNVPFGYWRAHAGKFSLQWFLAVHLPVLAAISLRVLSGLGWHLVTFPALVGAYCLGQLLGGRIHVRWSRNGKRKLSACLVAISGKRSSSMALALFDFDGTITFKDSFGDFISYAVGRRKFVTGTIVLSPVLLAYTLGVIPNWRAKELVSTHFFGGWDAASFEKLASKYSRERLPAIVREIALETISRHKLKGDTVVVVSASIDLWLTDWCASCAVDLIATELETKEGRLTGRFSTRNCSGIEKVRRIEERYDLKSFGYVYAYGDSAGDRAMLELANEKYYKWKRI